MPETPRKPIKAVLYSRVSTKDKGQDNENQLLQLREYAATQGWVITAEYCDETTGKTGNRPAFKRMFADAQRRRFDLVLFWSLDRFSREGVAETLNYLQRLTANGVDWKSFTEQYLDSVGVFRDAVLAILATIAKQERVRISERTVAGLERARKAGRVGGRPKVIVNREGIVEARKQGQSLQQIATDHGLSRMTVLRITRDAATV